jgi:WS/DGAT/MGAT family acyltransferase
LTPDFQQRQAGCQVLCFRSRRNYFQEICMSEMDHLSIIDGAFLHLESPEVPLHVGSLALFEPPSDDHAAWYEAVKAHVASRMHLAPVFTRKLALMPFDLANPVWIPDDDIDLDYHMRYVVLPKPGTLAQLETLAARWHSSLLDRSRPLWEFYVVGGLADGRIGFYTKVHHAAVDGQAAVALGKSIFDLTAEPRRVKPPRARRSNRYQLGMAELLSATLGNQATQLAGLVKLVPPLAGVAYTAAKSALVGLVKNKGKDDAANPDSTTRFKFAPPSPFNTSITNQRLFAGVSLPLPEIKSIGKAHGASINDMVLWLCSTALREYLRDSHELPEKSLVAGVPISLRADGDTTSNNQVSMTTIDLFTQEADPLTRLQKIVEATRAMKAQMSVFSDLIPKDFPSLGSPWLLSGLASLYGRSRLADRLRVANVTISNVPGPQVPLYLAGAKMVASYPVSIVIHGVALNITVQSYLAQLDFGLVVCRRAIPDVKELAHRLELAMQALRHLPAPIGVGELPVAAPAKKTLKRVRGTPKLTVVTAAPVAHPKPEPKRKLKRMRSA